ncbi:MULTISPECIES: sulfite exporter TauE/SafE family protein [unclassified Leptolyngbya]|uniref:sulfite exporter TauE/SafE family protein n=1 Tax=unclassified Leptolyngbya TaxID=2650499 RepID=UPI0016871F4A|nr:MULTISPECIES: sulfite exporter TauE/SafE family protein [unclassified Leptolyngbya]MBD1913312.1 sulfite exporter TauE/SafE family protein [Leptolyngbya sp. FACHB-8]MBD2155342.1 sulfite exporter TauE/SafE family protein [Leptolyngbya sp. FACHB-16]
MLETPIGWGLLLLVGCVTGTLAGVLGIGGGLLMVPVLTLFGIPLVEATATSLVGVLLSSISGSVQNLRMGDLNWRTSLLLALFGMLTAQVGAWIGDRVSDAVLSLAFAGLLVLTIWLMDLKRKLQQKQNAMRTDATEMGASESQQVTGVNALLPIAFIGLLAGLLSGLFGVGGGVVMVPLQMLMLSEPIKSAVRTSLGAIVPISVSGLAQHTLNNNVLWIPGIALGLGGILGAQAGTRMLPKLSDHAVNRLFRLFLIGLAVYMAIRGIRGL